MIDPKTVMYDEGRRQALALQEQAPAMTGTELISEEEKVPAWDPAKDYTGWKPGWPVVDEGQVWTLLQPHNAAHYPGRPSGLRALWGLAHTTDPAKAKPWVGSYGTSGLYLVDEVCIWPDKDGVDHIWRNLWDRNEFPPLTLNVESRWEELGEAGA